MNDVKESKVMLTETAADGDECHSDAEINVALE